MNIFLDTGNLLIGTLYDFRDLERHGQDIGDVGEGRITRFENIDEARGSDLSDFAKQSMTVQDDTLLVGVQVNQELNSPDYYIYSISASDSVKIAQQIDPDYDACIVIEDPLSFFEAIAGSMGCRIKDKWFVYKVHYGDKRVEHRQSVIHPATLKSTEYSYQREFRMIMEPTAPKIKPIILNLPEAIPYCSGKLLRTLIPSTSGSSSGS